MPLFKAVDLASPSPIGSTTPNTGRFTTLTLAPSANTTPFTASGYSLTGANAQSFFDLSGTWNTTGTPTAVLLNITDTASNASSVLLGMQIGSANRFQFLKDGRLRFNVSGTGILNNSSTGIEFIGDDVGIRQNNSTGAYKVYFGNSVGFRLGSIYYIGWSSGTYADHTYGTIDLTIMRDAADIFAQRRSTNAQTFRLYNTYTDASNYERGFFRWNTNVLEIGAEAAGTGTQRQTRVLCNATNNSVALGNTSSAGFGINGDASPAIVVGSSERFSVSASILALQNDANFGISFSSGLAFQADTFIRRDGTGNTLAMRNGTSNQTLRLYRTFTDASNHERLAITATGTTRFGILVQNAGTGSARSLEVSFYTSAADPTSTDITSGCFSVWKNSGTGTIKLWANDGGTMKSVALA